MPDSLHAKRKISITFHLCLDIVACSAIILTIFAVQEEESDDSQKAVNGISVSCRGRRSAFRATTSGPPKSVRARTGVVPIVGTRNSADAIRPMYTPGPFAI